MITLKAHQRNKHLLRLGIFHDYEVKICGLVHREMEHHAASDVDWHYHGRYGAYFALLILS